MFLRFRLILLAIVLPCVFVSCNKDDEEEPYDVVIDFQNVVIPNGKYNNDAGVADFFQEGIVKFQNSPTDWGARYGFVYSQMHNVTTFDYATNEYSAYVPDDPPGNKFMVGFISIFDAPSIEITFSKPVKDLSFDVANNTLAALAMKGKDPNGFAREFEEGDWFNLLIQVYDANGKALFLNNKNEPEPGKIPLAQDALILDEWMTISMTGGAVSKIEFSLESSDTGDWGMNTPAYFCIDNIKARTVK